MKEYTIDYSNTEPKYNMVFIAQCCAFLPTMFNAFRAGTIPQFFILAVAMLLPLILKPKEIPAYIVGFSMVGTGIQIAYVALACVVILFVKAKMRIRNISFVAIVVFAIYELAHVAFAPNDTLIEYLRFFSVYAMFFVGIFFEYDIKDKLKIINAYMYGTILSFVHIFIESYVFFNGNLLRFIDGSFRFGHSEHIGFDLTMAADPNAVGQGCTIIVATSLMLLMLGYKEKKYYATLFITLLVGTLTISKTFFISMALTVVFVFLFGGSFTSLKMLGRRIGLILLVGIGVFLITKVNPHYIENLLSRVDEGDVTTGRVRIAFVYIEYMAERFTNMLFGLGMQNVGPKIGHVASPHSALIEAVVCWGVVGTLMMFLLIFEAIRRQKSGIKTSIMNYAPLVIYLVIMQSTQLFRLRDRLFTLIVIIITIAIPKKEEKTKIENGLILEQEKEL